MSSCDKPPFYGLTLSEGHGPQKGNGKSVLCFTLVHHGGKQVVQKPVAGATAHTTGRAVCVQAVGGRLFSPQVWRSTSNTWEHPAAGMGLATACAIKRMLGAFPLWNYCPLVVEEPWGGLSVSQTGSDPVHSAETHRKPFISEHIPTDTPSGKEFWAIGTSMCRLVSPQPRGWNTVSPGDGSQSWLLSELSCRARSKAMLLVHEGSNTEVASSMTGV